MNVRSKCDGVIYRDLTSAEWMWSDAENSVYSTKYFTLKRF